MKKKHFYSHIIETSSLSIALGDMDLSHEERVHLISLTESSLHHAILDAILSELSEEDKKEFLNHVSSDDQEKIWDFLKDKIKNIEEKIKKTADDLHKELREDIKEAHRLD